MGGLASENVRWAESVENFRSQGVTLCGDVLLISAFVSYVGYFTKKYRNELMEKFWIPYVNNLKVRGAAVVRTRGGRGATPQGRYAAHAAPSLGLPQPYLLGLTSPEGSSTSSVVSLRGPDTRQHPDAM